MDEQTYRYDLVSLLKNIIFETFSYWYFFVFIFVIFSIVPAIVFQSDYLFMIGVIIILIVEIFIVIMVYLNRTTIEISGKLISVTKSKSNEYKRFENIQVERRYYSFLKLGLYSQINIIIPVPEVEKTSRENDEIYTIKCFGFSEKVNLALEKYINKRNVIDTIFDESQAFKHDSVADTYTFNKKRILEKYKKMRKTVSIALLIQVVLFIIGVVIENENVRLFGFAVGYLCIMIILFSFLVRYSVNKKMPGIINVKSGKIIFNETEFYIENIKNYTHRYDNRTRIGNIQFKSSNKKYIYTFWLDEKNDRDVYELLIKKLDSVL